MFLHLGYVGIGYLELVLDVSFFCMVHGLGYWLGYAWLTGTHCRLGNAAGMALVWTIGFVMILYV